MSTYYATCHTPDNNDADRRIQGLGGPVMGRLNIDTVIYMIDQGHTFYTQPPYGAQPQLIEIASRNGRRYLKTVADYVEPNNILALPRCP